MQKPEDVPQAIWDRADRVLTGNGWNPLRTVAIAKAILSAVEEENEACAEIADKRAIMAATVSHPGAVALLQTLPDAIRDRKGA